MAGVDIAAVLDDLADLHDALITVRGSDGALVAKAGATPGADFVTGVAELPASTGVQAVVEVSTTSPVSNPGRIAQHAALVVERLASVRAEADALAQELLDRYEEVTLLYDLSREVGVMLNVERAAQTALGRSLEVIPARLGMVFIATPDGDLVPIATGGSDHGDGALARLGRWAALQAMRRATYVMVHTGEALDGDTHTAQAPVLAVPLQVGEGEDVPGTAPGVLVYVGHGTAGMFSAGQAQLAATVARQLALGLENARLVAEVREKEGLERELELAAGMQRSLLPAKAPTVPNASLAAACLPATRVGGDYYDYLPGPDGVVNALVADVTGHGVGPGLIMAMTRSVLRAELRDRRPLPAALASTNAVMWEDLAATGVFITLFAVRYDPATRELRYVNGGHHPALLRHPDGSVEELDSDAMPLGLLPDPPYEEGVVVLEPGAVVLIFSDGVVETRSPDGELFGTPRLLDLVTRLGAEGKLIPEVLDVLERFKGGGPQLDDVTLVELRVAGEGEQSRRLPS